MLDQLLQRLGLKYEDLSAVEKETLNNWLQVLNKNELSVDKIREYVGTMRESVETELSNHRSGFIKRLWDGDRDTILKARLRNYMLLDAFLSSPEKAKKQIEKTMAGIVPKKQN